MDLELLRAALQSEDEEVRHEAIANLPVGIGAEALAVLVDAMGDESWRIRKEAVSRVAAWPDPVGVVPALCAALGEESNIARRNAAVEVLGLIGRPAVPLLLVELARGGPERKLVIDALGAIGDGRAVSPLTEVLGDADPNLRAAAAEALGHLGRRDCVPALFDVLRGSDLLTRLAALEALNRLGASVPYTALAPLLEEPVLRRAALEALGFAGDPEALPAMIEALGDRSRGAREAAATALVALHATVSSELAARIEAQLAAASPAALRGLCATLGAEPRPLKRAAATLLGWARRPETLPALCQALGDGATQDVAVAAILVFGPAAVGPLCDLCPELDPDLRAQVVDVIPRLGPVGGDARLVEMLGRTVCEDQDEPAAAAARALGEIGRAGTLSDVNATIGALFQALGREGPAATAAAQALGAMGGRYYDEVHTVVVAQGVGGPTGPYLCRILGACGRTADRVVLLAALKDEHAVLRRAAADALGALGRDSEVIEALVFALSDESVSVRAAAARALGVLRDGAATAALIAVAAGGRPGARREEDPAVRTAAIRALGSLGDPAALPVLRQLASAAEGSLASAALEALGPLSGEADEPLLVQALSHPDAEAIKAALRALGARRSSSALEALCGVLGHSRWDVRAAAAEAVTGRTEPTAQAALRERLETEDDDLVRQAISRALRGGRE
jgi:HEAT repeat protein